MALLCLVFVGRQLGLSAWYYGGLLVAAGFFVYQSWITRSRERERCFQAFLNNHYAGLAIFIGLAAHYALATGGA